MTSLEHAGQDVVNAGAAVGGGRALIHHEERRIGPFVRRTAEYVPLFPVIQDLRVEIREIDSAGDYVKLGRHA